MKITATLDEKLKLVYDCLCTGLPYFVSYGLELEYSEDEYKTARDSLFASARFDEGSICVEDVQTEMVRMGFSLIFLDGENDGEEAGRLNLTTLESNWDKVRAKDLAEWADENYDANTADTIIQCIAFGEIVYG